MPSGEIEVPKELREFMIDGAEETILGQKNGALRQYRYGNLHIREYEDKFLVHSDRVDPRRDPVGHLVRDAPEVLIGLACAVFGGGIAAKYVPNPKLSLAAGLALAALSGYLGHSASKKIKELLSES